jgi:hypothetical protein
MKKLLFLIVPVLLLITGCNDPATDNTYKIELNDPYIICGREIYFSNDSFNDEVDIDDIVETIQEACNYNK